MTSVNPWLVPERIVLKGGITYCSFSICGRESAFLLLSS